MKIQIASLIVLGIGACFWLLACWRIQVARKLHQEIDQKLSQHFWP